MLAAVGAVTIVAAGAGAVVAAGAATVVGPSVLEKPTKARQSTRGGKRALNPDLALTVAILV